MNFKDIVKQDNENVFLNPLEFAEKHTLNGKEMDISVDNDRLIKENHGGNRTDGLYSDTILIYVKQSQFGHRPKPGKIINLDNKYDYIVIDCIDNMGIYAITLQTNKL